MACSDNFVVHHKSTILVNMTLSVRYLTGCGLHGDSLVSVLFNMAIQYSWVFFKDLIYKYIYIYIYGNILPVGHAFEDDQFLFLIVTSYVASIKISLLDIGWPGASDTYLSLTLPFVMMTVV